MNSSLHVKSIHVSVNFYVARSLTSDQAKKSKSSWQGSTKTLRVWVCALEVAQSLNPRRYVFD